MSAADDPEDFARRFEAILGRRGGFAGRSFAATPGAKAALAREAVVDGATFALDLPPVIPPVWGKGSEVAWAQGEPCYIAGPPGVGKTTLGWQLTMGRLGNLTEVLGFPVMDDGRPVFYLAADRPRQAARALQRLVDETDRALLAERLVVWRGPPPTSVVDDPDVLLELCRRYGCGTLVIDSLKDVAIGLSEDSVGAALNAAVQRVIAADVEVLGLHHTTKNSTTEAKPTLSGVYGSTWITSGAGSVIGLHGQPGAETVRLFHLKQPDEVIGPLSVEHDHATGRSRIVGNTTPKSYVEAHPVGVSAQAFAAHVGVSAKTAKRRLDAAAKRSEVQKVAGVLSPKGATPDLYFPLEVPEEPPDSILTT